MAKECPDTSRVTNKGENIHETLTLSDHYIIRKCNAEQCGGHGED